LNGSVFVPQSNLSCILQIPQRTEKGSLLCFYRGFVAREGYLSAVFLRPFFGGGSAIKI
jgi:hypothetical protein